MEQLTVQQLIDVLSALPAEQKQLPVFTYHGMRHDYWPVVETEQLVYDLQEVPALPDEYSTFTDGLKFVDIGSGTSAVIQGVVL